MSARRDCTVTRLDAASNCSQRRAAWARYGAKAIAVWSLSPYPQELSMSTLSMSSVSLIVGAAALGAGVSWLVTALRYRDQLLTLAGQFDQAERARINAQELAVQARQQVEALQKALSEAKRDGTIQSAAASARAAAAAAEQAKAAKEKARVELSRQLDHSDAAERSSHGFADTQPFGR
jgi:hypothetical protein